MVSFASELGIFAAALSLLDFSIRVLCSSSIVSAQCIAAPTNKLTKLGPGRSGF
jgi:hypothetical protein